MDRKKTIIDYCAFSALGVLLLITIIIASPLILVLFLDENAFITETVFSE